jgi:triosephosphate isomerase (TIM)
MAGLKPLIAGNWKMFGRRADLAQIEAVGQAAHEFSSRVEVAMCPPAGLIALAAAVAADRIAVGAQTLDARPDGAHTGDLSAAMLVDLGARFVIVGHSERRADHGETDQAVAAKAASAQAAGLTPIVCVGESLAQRQTGEAESVVRGQVAAGLAGLASAPLVLAYEPIWAIGTGLTPSLAEIEAIHHVARQSLTQLFGPGHGARVLYGGSVKPANAGEILAVSGVDGALVGGASLRAADFLAIIRAHPALGAQM